MRVVIIVFCFLLINPFPYAQDCLGTSIYGISASAAFYGSIVRGIIIDSTLFNMHYFDTDTNNIIDPKIRFTPIHTTDILFLDSLFSLNGFDTIPAKISNPNIIDGSWSTLLRKQGRQWHMVTEHNATHAAYERIFAGMNKFFAEKAEPANPWIKEQDYFEYVDSIITTKESCYTNKEDSLLQFHLFNDLFYSGKISRQQVFEVVEKRERSKVNKLAYRTALKASPYGVNPTSERDLYTRQKGSISFIIDPIDYPYPDILITCFLIS